MVAAPHLSLPSGMNGCTVALIAKPGGAHTGVGRYTHMLHMGLEQSGSAVERVAPTIPPLPSFTYNFTERFGADVRTFLKNYPVWAKYPSADVYHLTSQNLASLLCFKRPPGKVVVTVHDIIPYMVRHNRQLNSYRTFADRVFDRMAMAGLRRADALIADSHYTKQCIVDQLGVSPEQIVVVYLGIDQQRFQPQPASTLIDARYGLRADRRYLLYVGSEDPRKNLATLIRALAAVRHVLPELELIKVGRAHFVQERERLLALASALGVRDAIHFLDDVSEADLPYLYSRADLCVMPSLYEGFGFPVLEAMACGTPVIAADASSLPELVGDAGLMFNTENTSVVHLAQAITRVLNDPGLRQTLKQRGRAHAATFNWPRTVQQTQNVYNGCRQAITFQ